jgi:predicted transposase/invertase (TIGR01784 family)
MLYSTQLKRTKYQGEIMCVYERYINPFTDFGFKKIFGDQNDTSLLESLINDILGFEGEDKIATIVFKNGELLPDNPEDRRAIFDLYCTDEKGCEFIVELQKVHQEHFQSRALYYATFPIQEQALRGKWNFSLTPIYFIGLLNFEIDKFRDRPNYLHHGKITDIQTKEVMYENLNMIYVEIPKLKKEREELSNHLEWWLYTFQNLNQLQEIPLRFKGDIIEKAFNRAEFINLPKAEQDKYHKNLKIYRDLVNSLDTAHAEGKLEGKLEGEKSKSIEIAKKSLSQNIDIQIIALITGLTTKEIKALKL